RQRRGGVVGAAGRIRPRGAAGRHGPAVDGPARMGAARRHPADGRTLFGVALGLAGLALLVGPNALLGGERVDPLGAAALVLGSLSWAAGSLYSRRAPLPRSPLLGTAMEMLAGGALLTLLGLAVGEAGAVDLDAVSLRSILALLYLI